MPIALLAVSPSFAQGSRDSIKTKKVFGGYQFTQRKNPLKMKELVTMMKPNEAAYREIKGAQSNSTVATIIGGVGGFLIGYTLGTAVTGRDANWTVAAAGGGLIVVSIPFTIAANRHARRAVDLYNSGLRNSGFLDRTVWRFGASGNAVGLTLSF